MRISDWSSDVCSSDLQWRAAPVAIGDRPIDQLTDRQADEEERQRALHRCRVGREVDLQRRKTRQVHVDRQRTDRDDQPDTDHPDAKAAVHQIPDRSALRSRVSGKRPVIVGDAVRLRARPRYTRSAEHTTELQSLMRISYAASCLKKKKQQN